MRKVFLVIIFAGFLSILSCSSQSKTTGITIDEVETSLSENNVKVTLEKYFNCEKYAGSAYEKIASGSPEWISLAEMMLKYSDACYTEGIQASLGEAMRKAPRDVLRLVNKTTTLGANYICLPFISSELPIKEQLEEIEVSKKIIQSVRDDKLLHQQKACLQFIKTLEADLKSQDSSMPEKSKTPLKEPSPGKLPGSL